MRVRRPHAPLFGLNMTPLIDVVFILIVFFMLASNFANYRLIRVETPRETQVLRTSEGAIVIAIKRGGEITFDGNPATLDKLSNLFAEVVAIDPGRQFLIRPFSGVPLQDAITVYDLGLAAGASSVSFSAPGEGSAP